MPRLTVVFDACVLYPAPLRDFLLHLALTDLFRAKWTQQIHHEWKSRLLANRPDLTLAQLDRTQRLMDASLPDCLVSGYEDLVPSIHLPDENDRHVVAAAITANASTIVTFNLRDFPASELSKYEIEAVHPDEFVMRLFAEAPQRVCLSARRQRASLKNPPKTVDEFLGTLESQGLLRTAAALRTSGESL